MTYTPEDLRHAAKGAGNIGKMLRAGADAMEREKQARNLALEEAAVVCDTVEDELYIQRARLAVEDVADWIRPQRIDQPMTGEESANAMIHIVMEAEE